MPYDELVRFMQGLLSKRIALGMVFPVLFCLAACGPKVPSLDDLAKRSRKILELQSCEFVYRDVVYRGENDKLLGLLTTKETRVLFSINLKVKAGIDLAAGIQITPIDTPAGKPGPAIKLILPPATIQGVDAAEDSIHQYFVFEYGLFNDSKVDWLGVQDEVEKAKSRAKADAIKRGILEKAWNNSSVVMTKLFRLSGFPTVIIEKAPQPKTEAGQP